MYCFNINLFVISAETIRKMLADLPAKRHRVMVNPVNVLSRPRRKLEQRTKLILKKRPSEDHKNRRCIRKETKDAKQDESAIGGETSKEKNLKQELDDEDNKPLRPKIKRIISARKFQHNSVNRKTIIKRAKRRSIRVEQKKNTENTDSPAGTGGVEIPTTDTPQRIDVNREPYNTREQANRGGSNRREEQRPGCSGSNGNANNFCAPAQNVPPLKHSIARLTANSETHDKSVQFHHSFLVQQECNNTDQHLPTGHHTYFENEAIVTKLDKPPLYATKGSLDLYALQKSKLNKPRKGLNDCIAMLKNKLVEPEPHCGAPTSHISVQCGSDEPIDVGLPPLIEKQVLDINESMFQIPVNSQSKSVQTNEVERYSIQKKQDKRSKSVLLQPTDETNNQSSSFRRRSTTHNDITELLKNSIKLNSNIEIIPMHSHSENVDITAKNVQKPLQDLPRHPIQKVIHIETSPIKIQCNDIRLQSEMTPIQTYTVSCTSIPWQKSLEIVPITSKPSDSSLPQVVPSTSKTSDPSVPQVDHHTNEQPYNLKNIFSENMTSQTVPDARLECRQMPQVPYTERSINIRTAIPPAHANSRFDCPLDLSNKNFITCEAAISQDLSIRDGPCMVCDYEDTYATLDLSNKGIDATNEVAQELHLHDTVVDLRVKSTAMESSLETLDLSLNNNMIANLSLGETDTENEPTDLSVRGKGNSMSTDLTCRIVEENDIDFVQDLSTRNTLRERECISFSSEEDNSPTDLSARGVQVLVGGKDAIYNYENVTEATNLVVRSERSSYGGKKLFQPQLEIISKQSKEGSKVQETLLETEQSRVTDTSCPLILNSAYNPSLKGQLYKNTCITNEKVINCVEVTTFNPMSKQFSQSQDSSLFSAHSSNDSSTPTVLPSVLIKSATNTTVGSVPGYLLPSPTTTSSTGKLESTKPVYALTNTCISMTKDEPTTSAMFTSSLLSTAGTTTTTTTPVYALAGTTVATPEHQSSVIEAELKNNTKYKDNNASCVSAICDSETFNCESENTDKDFTEEDKDQLISDMLKSLTPDRAQRIFVLPDHIKLILAMMQPDHRNQLMNVLPQFLPIIDELSRASNGNASHTVTSASSDIITSQIQRAVNLSNMICSASTSHQAFNIQLCALKLPNAVLPVTTVPTSVTANETQSVDQDLRVSKEVKEESFTIDADKYLVDPATGVVASRPKDFNRNCIIIDLTDDDNVPNAVDVVKAAEELPQVVCQDQPTLPVINTVRQRSNDQTASLRAVRIKAPSERHRETQLSKRVSEEQKPQLAKNDTEVDVNRPLEAGKGLVLQQPEVNNTINEKKLQAGSKLVVRLAPIDLNSGVVTTLTQKQSPAAGSPVKSDHGSLLIQHSGNNQVNPSISVEAKQEIVYENQKYAATANPSPKNLLSDACTPKKLKILEENSMDESLDMSDTSTIIESDFDRDDLDDEDSEDDVSLAIIVKKKQRDELILKCHIIESHENKHSHKLTSGKKKKKEKKSKVHRSKKRKLTKNQEQAESVHSLTDPSKDEVDSEDTEGNDNITDDNKNFKKKAPSPQLGEVDVEQQGQPDIDKDKENYIAPEGSKTSAAPDDSTETLQASERSSKSIDIEMVRPQSPLNEASVKTTNVKESMEAAKTSLVNLQKEENEDLDNTKNSCTANLTENSPSANLDEQNEICENDTSDRTCATSATEESGIADCCDMSKNDQDYIDSIGENSAIESHDAQEFVKPSNSLFEKDSNFLNDDKNKAMCSKKSEDDNSFQMVVTNEFSASCDVGDETAALPLRRSRRGKTLFVDGNLPDHENLTTENSIEKTPLTKKQLIFSKLLLDEENHNKCPEVIIGDHNTRSDRNEVVLNTECTSNAIGNGFEPLEKGRPSKRKNSPQLKRKSKKKKSLDLERFTQEETSTNNTDHVNQQAVDDNTVNMTTDTQLKDIGTGTEKIYIVESGHVLSRGWQDSNKQSSENPVKLKKVRDIEDSAGLTPNIICEDLCNKFDNNRHLSSAEKRKLVSAATNVNSTPKPKKTKLSKIDGDEIREKKCARVSTDQETVYEKRGVSYIASTRRTRSKSVIVKSSNSDFYDPYDIDLDDIPEKAEPFRKTFFKCKETKVKNTPKPCTIVSSQAIEAEISSNHNIESSEISLISRPTTDISEGTDDGSDQNDVLEKTECKLNIDAIAHKDVNDYVHDSDDSSKSDVPLKRYVEEKEKRLELSSKKVSKHRNAGGSSVETNGNNCNHKNKKNRTSVSVESSSSSARETEEQLRSEQFMESFGFFSERKPRKSNLLASKKISETFHIIANESDDGYKERTPKKRLNENRKSKEGEGTETLSKTNTKRGRKKKPCTSTETCYCYICKKEFRRPDNYLRHQMTLLHISKLSEVELRVKTVPVPEEPNYLIPYKQQLERLKVLTRKLAKQKKNSKSKIKLPTIEEILENVHETVREQQLSRTNRSLSRDEALFIDCCELLKESHKNEPAPNPESLPMSADVTFVSVAHCSTSVLELIPKTDTNDGDVDSITAKTILESEEVRNLENDLISGLKEAAEAANAAQSQMAMNYQQTLHESPSTSVGDGDQNLNISEEDVSHYDDKKIDTDDFETTEETLTMKHKKHPEIKEKMYPDIGEIDMFEDKFDKIKRKCRSQAAAAKHIQPVIESSGG